MAFGLGALASIRVPCHPRAVRVAIPLLSASISVCLALTACEPPPPRHELPAQTPSEPASEARPTIPEPGPDGLRELAGVHYLEYTTAGASADETLPMIVAIHGLGDSPEGFANLLRGFDRKARVIVPRAFDRYGRGWSWFPIRMADGDDAAIGAAISNSAAKLAPAIEQLAATYPTQGRPYVTGFSQGGMLSFALAVEHGELITAAFPVGGWLPEPLWPSAGPKADAPPIVAFHGEADDRVPFAPTQAAVTKLDSLGYAVELHGYAGVGHSISRPMHAELSASLGAAIDKESGK